MAKKLHQITKQNRRAWNEIAGVREKTFPTAAFFAQGGSMLGNRIVELAGDFKGRSLLHLQCATGEDTLSWAVLGAKAVGVDISDEQINLAQQKAREAGLDVDFHAADVFALPEELVSGSFDYVFTGGGALVWMPDIWLWARVVSACLKPGGHLLLQEIHPITGCLWVEGDRLVISNDYFGRSKPFEERGWFHFKGGEHAQETKFEFSWPLGDVITAIVQAGMRIDRVEELPGGEVWRYGAKNDAYQLPGEFILVAEKV